MYSPLKLLCIFKKYIDLIIKEASNVCIPDLIGYEDRCPTGSFLNSDNIRKNSGYIQTKRLGHSFCLSEKKNSTAKNK